MRQHKFLLLLAGLGALALAGPAAAGCGLEVNPVALDSNGNAELSRSETANTPLAGVFDRVDSNGDGVISQSEFAGRCASLSAKTDNGWGADWEDTVAGERADRQRQRQQDRVNNRVNQESDRAADSAVDKVMGAIFGH